MIALIVDAILVLVPLEAALLIALHRLTGHGLPSRQLIATLSAGFFIALALRLTLGGFGDGPVAVCLLLSLVAHVLDLAGRWRRG